MIRLSLIILCSLFMQNGYSQYNWKLEKEKNGIRVYLSSIPDSKFKAVKVECTFTGT